jgi:hypothetical protein
MQFLPYLHTGPAVLRYKINGHDGHTWAASFFFVMDRVAPSWDPMDPNVLSMVDPNSDLGRDLAISLQATAEEEEENNTGRLTDE